MNSEDRKEARNYAWNYFSLHSDQRLKGFNFFLILSGLFLGAFPAVKKIAPNTNLVAFLPLMLALIAFIFWRLDERTRRLVRNAEEAIKHLDNEWTLEDGTDGEPHCLKLFARDDFRMETLKRKWWAKTIVPISYTDCFNLAYLIAGGLGFVLGLWDLVT